MLSENELAVVETTAPVLLLVATAPPPLAIRRL
jgi:hypothetical protein